MPTTFTSLDDRSDVVDIDALTDAVRGLSSLLDHGECLPGRAVVTAWEARSELLSVLREAETIGRHRGD